MYDGTGGSGFILFDRMQLAEIRQRRGPRRGHRPGPDQAFHAFGAAFCAYVAIGIQFVAPIVYRGTTVGYTTYAGSLFAMLVGLLIWWPESWIAEK